MSRPALTVSGLWEPSDFNGVVRTGGLGGLLIDFVSEPPEGLLRLSLTVEGGPGRQLIAVGRRVRVVGQPDSVWGLKLLRLISPAGLAPLKELLRTFLHAELDDIPEEQVFRHGTYWSVVCSPEDSDAAPPAPYVLSAEAFAECYHQGEGSFPTLYPRASISYAVGMLSYQGKAVRITESSMTVFTNRVLPPLGATLYIQFLLGEGEERGFSVVRGVVSRRSNQREKGAVQGMFEVKIRDVQDMEARGLFERFLGQLKESPEPDEE